MNEQRITAMALAAVWGIGATWIFWWLFDSVFGTLFIASQTPVKALLHSGWSAQQIRPYLSGLLNVVAALFYGVIFGVPLGLVGRRFLIAAWATFVIAFLIALVVRMFIVRSALENLVSLIYPLTFLATLLFAFIVYRIRFTHGDHAAA